MPGKTIVVAEDDPPSQVLFADSDGIRAPVPIESGHLFRRIRAPLEGGLRVAPA